MSSPELRGIEAIGLALVTMAGILNLCDAHTREVIP